MSEDGDFFTLGWQRFPYDASVATWVERVTPTAMAILDDPEHRERWMRCGDTWFAGVNVLPNDAVGAIEEAEVPPLSGPALDFIRNRLGLTDFAWDSAQLSTCFPGYPQPWDSESEAAFGYRKNRDAAHVDGLIPQRPNRRRTLGEVHSFIMGMPITDAGPDASPLTVYEGSHEIMRAAFKDRFADIPPRDWAKEDITETYVATRKICFEQCRRVAVHAKPGQAYLIHRLALHGVSPWIAGDGMRMIAYFRPDPFPGADPSWWLERP